MLAFSVDEAQVLNHVIGALTSTLTMLAVVAGGFSGLRRYKHDLKIKSGELLLRMEEEYRAIAHVCLRIETPSAYDETIKPLLDRLQSDVPLSNTDLASQAELDRCLRFFYLCTVLHTDLKVEQAIVARSYYWHASILLDTETRPELASYVRQNYHRLTEWLTRHQGAFAHYRETGEWKEEGQVMPRLMLRLSRRNAAPYESSPRN